MTERERSINWAINHWQSTICLDGSKWGNIIFNFWLNPPSKWVIGLKLNDFFDFGMRYIYANSATHPPLIYEWWYPQFDLRRSSIALLPVFLAFLKSI